ncbi:MAG: flagellar biosynthetic protein FliP, partial [Parvularculaceae bacterium]|nr:flagellar biosynthetic protein FliP [Parvularculaceae bacterium]
VVVLSLLRTAIGVQQSPPNPVIISLAMFLTAFVMAPTFGEAYTQGIQPLMADEMPLDEALPKAAAPVKEFMLSQTREKDLALFVDMSETTVQSAAEAPLYVVTPAFMISELRRA